jgi:hypothetical protein
MNTCHVVFTALVLLSRLSYLPTTIAQDIINGPDVVYVTYSPAIYLTQAPSQASPPPNPGSGNTPVPYATEQPEPSPTVEPYLPATPINLLSCARIGEPWWGCLSTENCEFDDAGDPACCPVGEFCRGVVDDGDGAGPRAGYGTGAWSAGTKAFNVSNELVLLALLLVTIWCIRLILLFLGR